jgi:hypothetical protein
MRRMIVLIMLLAYLTGLIPNATAQSKAVSASLSAFDNLPPAAIAQMLKMNGLLTPDPLALSRVASAAVAAPSGVAFIDPTLLAWLAELIQLVAIAKGIYGEFSEMKNYWEELYGSVKYLLTKQFWVAQVLNPLSSCLPKDGLFLDIPGDMFVTDLKEFLDFIAGTKPFGSCSPGLQNILTKMIGGLPKVYDEFGNIVDSPTYANRTWQIYEANNAVNQVATARNGIKTLEENATQFLSAIASGQNIPKNTAIAVGSVLQAEATNAQLEATKVALEAQNKMEELAAQKSMEEATSASFEMFRSVPDILLLSSQTGGAPHP